MQCMDHTGFATAQGSVCFLGLHCSGSRVLCKGTVLSGPCGFLHFPGLSHSGSLVLCKGTDPIGCIFCALPRSKQLRSPEAWRMHCPRWAVCLNHLPGPGHPVSWVLQESNISGMLCVSSGELMSTIQHPRKMWLETGNLLTVWWKMPSLGPRLHQPLAFPFWLSHFSASSRRGAYMQPACSLLIFAQFFVL